MSSSVLLFITGFFLWFIVEWLVHLIFKGEGKPKTVDDCIRDTIEDMTYTVLTTTTKYDNYVTDDIARFLMVVSDSDNIVSLFEHSLSKEKLLVIVLVYNKGHVKSDELIKMLYFILTLTNSPYNISFGHYYNSVVVYRGKSGRELLNEYRSSIKKEGGKYVEYLR